MTNCQNGVVVFNKTNELYGGLSNRCGDFPILINQTRIRTNEHLYQSLKFPNHPEIQKMILEKPSPLVAKWVTKNKNNKKHIRDDWELIKLEVMEYCLRVKLIYHWIKFGNLLRNTENKEIIEISPRKRDVFWGATQVDTEFRGENHLGQLLMKLRNEFVNQDNENLRILVPPPHLNLVFLGSEIKTIDRRRHLLQVGTKTSQ
jgi:ribA/ribD-fused uncharacterized protein